MKLYLLNGEERGRTYEIKDGVTLVGRSPRNHIQLGDSSVSREHIRIIKENGTLFIQDLSSRNGTFVNGNRIEAGRRIEVKEGTPISIGNTFFSLGKMWPGRFLFIQEPAEPTQDTLETQFPGEDHIVSPPRYLELVYKVSQVLMQTLDINDTLERILDHIFDLLKRIDRGVILLRDHETGKVLKTISRIKNKGRHQGVPYSRKIVDRVIRTGRPVMILDTMAQDRKDLSESISSLRIRSVMCVPLISRSQVRGVIYVDSLEVAYGFRREDLSLLTTLSGPAAVAIENAMLYRNLERLVETRTTALKETEKRLRESETRFRAVFDNMRSGVVVYGPVSEGTHFVVLDMNRAALEMEGLKLSGETGRGMSEARPHLAEPNEQVLEILRRVNQKGRPERRSIVVKSDNGRMSYRDYHVYGLPSGELVTIYDDVTAKRMADEEQKALQEQLFQSQKMESIGAFAGGIAHNFRNLLQAISGNIEYLEMTHPDEPRLLDLTKNVHESVKKGADLVNNLLQFSKHDVNYELTKVDLSQIITETYEIIKRVFNKNIKILLELENDVYVEGNKTLLSQVFMNLYTNARDAMPEGGELKITARKSGKKAVAVVADTGSGMEEETLGKIFDPFFTLKEIGKGTGLGLSTSHGIIKQHNGSISAKSKPGLGTSFTIELPLVAPPEKIEEREDEKNEILFGRGQRILIIDDELPTLQAITSLVRSLGYEPVPMERPYVALRDYDRISPELVLIDRSMPDMDGTTWINEVKRTDPHAKIIVLSGYEMSGPDGMDASARDLIKGYITKPCGIQELSKAIFEALYQ